MKKNILLLTCFLQVVFTGSTFSGEARARTIAIGSSLAATLANLHALRTQSKMHTSLIDLEKRSIAASVTPSAQRRFTRQKRKMTHAMSRAHSLATIAGIARDVLSTRTADERLHRAPQAASVAGHLLTRLSLTKPLAPYKVKQQVAVLLVRLGLDLARLLSPEHGNRSQALSIGIQLLDALFAYLRTHGSERSKLRYAGVLSHLLGAGMSSYTAGSRVVRYVRNKREEEAKRRARQREEEAKRNEQIRQAREAEAHRQAQILEITHHISDASGAMRFDRVYLRKYPYLKVKGSQRILGDDIREQLAKAKKEGRYDEFVRHFVIEFEQYLKTNNPVGGARPFRHRIGMPFAMNARGVVLDDIISFLEKELPREQVSYLIDMAKRYRIVAYVRGFVDEEESINSDLVDGRTPIPSLIKRIEDFLKHDVSSIQIFPSQKAEIERRKALLRNYLPA